MIVKSLIRKAETTRKRPLNIADISVLTAIFAGGLSFLSPCVLPLVPPYLCYMAGVSMDDFQEVNHDDGGARRSIMLASFFFTLGFSTVFVALGAGASSIGGLLRAHMDILAQIAGVVIIIMGLHFLGIFRIGMLNREAVSRVGERRRPSPVPILWAWLSLSDGRRASVRCSAQFWALRAPATRLATVHSCWLPIRLVWRCRSGLLPRFQAFS